MPIKHMLILAAVSCWWIFFKTFKKSIWNFILSHLLMSTKLAAARLPYTIFLKLTYDKINLGQVITPMKWYVMYDPSWDYSLYFIVLNFVFHSLYKCRVHKTKFCKDFFNRWKYWKPNIKQYSLQKKWRLLPLPHSTQGSC